MGSEAVFFKLELVSTVLTQILPFSISSKLYKVVDKT